MLIKSFSIQIRGFVFALNTACLVLFSCFLKIKNHPNFYIINLVLRLISDETRDYIFIKQEKTQKMCSNTQNLCSRAHKIIQYIFLHLKRCDIFKIF